MRALLYIFSLFFSFSFALGVYPYPDFENMLDPAVIEIKRIELPEYPYAFNPSFVRWKDIILMTFRLIDTPIPLLDTSCGLSKIGIVELDANFNPLGKPQFLSFSSSFSRPDDPRLVTVDDQLYMIYSDNRDPYPSDGGFRVYIAEIGCQENKYILLSDERIERFEDLLPGRREKNWTPFDYYGYLLLTYTMQPFKIYYPLLGEQECLTMCSSWNTIDWAWGDLRGGTPALPIDNGYLGIFHSCLEISSLHSSGEKVLHYFMGAYTFTRHPPFLITHISPAPIIGSNFYHGSVYDPYWKPVRVVFPCGLIDDGSYLWISYGRQDHEMWVAKIDKKMLLNSLVPAPVIQITDNQSS
jgi:predicted GH43/DUF377 family glycosyl hydrolase